MTTPTASVAGLVGFVQLADECRVIKTSPAWSEVKLALDWIDESRKANREIDPFDERLGYIGGFAKLLRDSSVLIANALVCSAAIGACRANTTRGDRIRAGMRAISRGFHFENLGETETDQALSRVRALVAGEFPALREWVNDPPLALGAETDALALWTTAVARRVELVEQKLTSAGFNMPALETRAWNDWKRRVSASFPTASNVEPTLAELACAAADIAPSPTVRFDPARVTVAEWSALAIGVLEPPPTPTAPPTAPATSNPSATSTSPTPSPNAATPRWIAPLALHASGFRMTSEAVLARLTGWGVPTTDARSWTAEWPWLFSGKPPRLGVLILKLAANSAVESWSSPAEGVAMFMVTPDVARRLVTVPPKGSTEGDAPLIWLQLGSSSTTIVPLPITHLVIEVSSAPQPPPQTAPDAWVTTLREAGVRVMRVYGQAPSARVSGEATIVADNADQFVRQLLRSVTSLA